ncbi:serine hydrolase, partial [Enterococcus faecium]
MSLSFLAVLLLAVSFFSSGIITGWQLTKQPQPQINKTEPAQLASNLTSNE